MRLARLDLTRYGKFTDQRIDFGQRTPGQPDLHIVYGPNEAGKSTALAAYLDLLFGIETQSRFDFLHPYKAMRIGAALQFDDGEAPELVRIKRPQNSLLDENDRPLSDAALLRQIGGLDRDSYRNMFSLDDKTLELGGESILASKGDLGQLLFSASAGLADLSRILEDLRADADSFHRARARTDELAELKKRLAALKDERDRLDTLASAFTQLLDTGTRTRAQYEDALAQRSAFQVRASAIQRHLNALPRLAKLRALQEKIRPLASLPEPPLGWPEQLTSLQREEIELSTQRDGCAAEIERLTAERDAIAIDEAALLQAARIDRLADGRARYVTAAKDLPDRRLTLQGHDAGIAGLLHRLERTGEPDPDRLVLGASVIGTFRDLIEARSGIDAALATARTQHADALQEVAEARALLEETGDAGRVDDGGPAIEALIATLSAVRGSEHGVRQRSAERALAAARDALDDQMILLRPWTGDADRLAASTVPQAADVALWKKSEAEADRAIDLHDADLQRLTTESLRLRADLETAGTLGGLATDAEAAAIRGRRETAWADHRRDLQAMSADTFEAALREDDLVTGVRLGRQNEIARQRQIGQTLAVAEADLARAQVLRDEAAAARSRVRSEIARALRASGWPDPVAASPADCEAWLAQRARCLELRSKLREAERSAREAGADADAARHDLASRLAAVGVTDALAADLTGLVAQAQELIDRETRLAGRRARSKERESALVKRERDLARATAAERDWTAAWAEACSGCWLGEAKAVPTLGVVREIIAAVVELGPLLEKRDALAERIRKMEDDQAAFTHDVEDLAARFGPASGAGNPLDGAERMTDSVRQARADASRRQDTTKRLEDLLGRQRDLTQASAIHAKRSDAMTRFFGVTELGAVAVRLRQAEERAGLLRQAQETEQEILDEVGAPTLEAAEALLAVADRQMLEAERADLMPRIDDIDQRTRHLFAEHGKAADAIEAVGGDDAVARIAETRRTVLLDIEEKALRYLRLRVGVVAAEQALRAYRDQHRSSMMSRASEAFRTVSRGAYRGLAAQPGRDGDVLVALTEGGSKVASDLSKGTRFQLYLALRVAGYHEFVRTRGPVPFIADDIMETFDDFRAEEAFRLFVDMAEVGQVIYLTHHRHLCDIARAACPSVRITELPGASIVARADPPDRDQSALRKAANASA